MKTILFFTFFLITTVVQLAAQELKPTLENVSYVNDNVDGHKLDLYLHNDGNIHPLIIHIHGGGWSFHSKWAGRVFCDSMYRAGYVVADINYRLSGDSIWPAQIYDCKTAVRFLKENANKYGIDTNFVAVHGESAGGHLAVMLGATIGVDALEGYHLGSTKASSKVDAVVNFYGVTYLPELNVLRPINCPELDIVEDSSMVTKLLGCNVSDCSEKAEYASPLIYIDGNEPPMLSLHGSEDCAVEPAQSFFLHQRMFENGMDSELMFYPGVGHSSTYWDFWHSVEVEGVVMDFLNKIYK